MTRFGKICPLSQSFWCLIKDLFNIWQKNEHTLRILICFGLFWVLLCCHLPYTWLPDEHDKDEEAPQHVQNPEDPQCKLKQYQGIKANFIPNCESRVATVDNFLVYTPLSSSFTMIWHL